MSFGEELRRERELRQISLREIANATKIDLRQLEALERNDFARLPGGVYNRGYVRAYCEHIGLDAESMVNAYLLEERSQEVDDRTDTDDGLLRGTSTEKLVSASGGDPPFVARGRRRALRLRSAIVLIVVGILLAVGAAFVWRAVAAPDVASRAVTSDSEVDRDGRGVQ